MRCRQSGLGAIAAIIVLVILAGLASVIVSIGSAQHLQSAQNVMVAKAWQAAKAGNEWGIYQALKGGSCSSIPKTLDLLADTGFNVTVYCESRSFNEGVDDALNPQAVRFYEIRAVACPSTSCPSVNATETRQPGYIERTRVVVASN